MVNGFENADLVAADVQGAELMVLKGATSLLATAKAVIVEVSLQRFYDGGVLQPELRAFLRQHGFIEVRRPPNHGDQLFLRKSLFGPSAASATAFGKRAARSPAASQQQQRRPGREPGFSFVAMLGPG